MVARFDDVVHGQNAALRIDRARFENKARLLLREAASLNMIGIICEFDLNFVVYAARKPRVKLRSQRP